MNKESTKGTINNSCTSIPLTFIPNKGQIDTKVKFHVRGTHYGFYFTDKEVVLSYFTQKTSETNGVTLALQFLDANPDVKVEGLNKTSGKVNYFTGKDQSKWITDLATFEKLIYKELWKGIDLVFYSKDNALKYDFILHPGASVESIKLTYRGSEGISLDDKGNLQIHNDFGVLIDERPISYQEIGGRRIKIGSRFEIINTENDEAYFQFKILDDYNFDYPLIIDPGLIFSSFLGAIILNAGTNEGDKLGIAVDKSGNIYVAGGTLSSSFPVTLGAFQEVSSNSNNEEFTTSAYVAKLNTNGSSLIYATFLSGSSSDEARSIAIDSMGNAYVTGETNSSDFPVTLGAFQEDFPGLTTNLSSAFVAKLSSDGSQLIYSTFLGGSNDDEGTAIDIDFKGNAYITGETTSLDFPVTSEAFQQNFPSVISGDSVFVTKLNPDGSNLVYSTFLGGSNDDEGLGIAVNDMGNAFVTGNTESPDFPVTVGAFQQINLSAPQTDSVFVTKLNPQGSDLIYSTFISGRGNDAGNRIAIDKMGNAYIGGETTSSDFPITAGAFQEDFSAEDDAAFVTKLNPDGSALVYSTFLNGTKYDVDGRVVGDNEVQGIAVDDMGNAYVAGFSSSPDFPVTQGAFQENFQSIVANDEIEIRDAFVAKLGPDGTILLYSTFLGGSEDDIARDIAIDQEGNAYIVGYTTSSDFPVTLGAFDVDFRGEADNSLYDTFVAKINPFNLQ